MYHTKLATTLFEVYLPYLRPLYLRSCLMNMIDDN